MKQRAELKLKTVLQARRPNDGKAAVYTDVWDLATLSERNCTQAEVQDTEKVYVGA